MWPPPDVTLRGGLQVNKFEQFLSEDHKIISRRTLYSEVQCITGNFHMGTPCEQTDTSEKITFPQLRWWAVITDALDE